MGATTNGEYLDIKPPKANAVVASASATATTTTTPTLIKRELKEEPLIHDMYDDVDDDSGRITDVNDDDNSNNATFYETYDDTKAISVKIPLSPPPNDKLHLLAGEEVQNEIEISDLEMDEDDADSVVSAFSNDHNYNMSPIAEPVSPISSSATDRSTPDTIHTMDPGYESQFSPHSNFGDIDEIPIVNIDDFVAWNELENSFITDPISELFPSLV